MSIIFQPIQEKPIQYRLRQASCITAESAIATRQKHLRTLLTLSRLLNKNWEETTKDDIDGLIFKVMDQFADENGQETHYSYDHKKILKIFFRWYKLDSREFIQACDPPEIKNVRVKKIKDKLNSDQEILDSTKNSIKAIRGIQHN